MSNAVASNLVGEPLIQVIGESVTEPSTTPELFTPPSPTPRLDSEHLIDGSEDRPPELPDALVRLQNSGHHFQATSHRVNRGMCVGTT